MENFEKQIGKKSDTILFYSYREMNYPDSKIYVSIILNSSLATLFEREGKRRSAFIIESVYRGVS